jgi:hypothetical protein
MSAMPAFKAWSLCHVPDRSRDPVANRRSKMIERLGEQLKLAGDPSYIRKKNKWTGKGNDRHRIEVEQRIRPWWRSSPEGGLVFVLFVGSKPVELHKGLAGIATTEKNLTTVIEQAIEYVSTGQLDAVLTTVAAKVAFRPKRRAA